MPCPAPLVQHLLRASCVSGSVLGPVQSLCTWIQGLLKGVLCAPVWYHCSILIQEGFLEEGISKLRPHVK